MDIYTITQLRGKDPTDRNARKHTQRLLARYDITPIRRGWYDAETVRAWLATYSPLPGRRKKSKAPTTP